MGFLHALQYMILLSAICCALKHTVVLASRTSPDAMRSLETAALGDREGGVHMNVRCILKDKCYSN